MMIRRVRQCQSGFECDCLFLLTTEAFPVDLRLAEPFLFKATEIRQGRKKISYVFWADNVEYVHVCCDLGFGSSSKSSSLAFRLRVESSSSPKSLLKELDPTSKLTPDCRLDLEEVASVALGGLGLSSLGGDSTGFGIGTLDRFWGLMFAACEDCLFASRPGMLPPNCF